MIPRVPARPSGSTKWRTNRPPAGHPLLIHHQVAHLAVHLLDGLAGDLGVVLRLAQILGHCRVPKLEVRHVNIHHPVQEPQGLQGVIPSGIIY